MRTIPRIRDENEPGVGECLAVHQARSLVAPRETVLPARLARSPRLPANCRVSVAVPSLPNANKAVARVKILKTNQRSARTKTAIAVFG